MQRTIAEFSHRNHFVAYSIHWHDESSLSFRMSCLPLFPAARTKFLCVRCGIAQKFLHIRSASTANENISFGCPVGHTNAYSAYFMHGSRRNEIHNRTRPNARFYDHDRWESIGEMKIISFFCSLPSSSLCQHLMKWMKTPEKSNLEETKIEISIIRMAVRGVR